MLDRHALNYVNGMEQEALELLKELAQIPAPSGKEERRAVFCRDWLTAHGAKGVFIDDALNVVYPVGVEETNPVVVFAAHTDVVFPDEEPLPLTEEDGVIRCPGVGDDTACVVALLTAARYVAEQKIRPQGVGLLFVCNSGEEGLGNLKGTRQICKDYEGRIQAFISFDCKLDEFVHRAVGSQRYRLRVRTKGGHSYYAFGEKNAIAELAGIIGRLYGIEVPQGGKTTFNVGTISGGTSVNTIAQEAEALYEFRSDCREDLEIMEKAFRKVMEEAAQREGVQVEYEVVGIRPCAGGGDPERQKMLEHRALWAVYRTLGYFPKPRKASTDCNIPMSLGIPSVCVGSFMGGGAHTRQEYLRADSLKSGLGIALDLALGYCRDDDGEEVWSLLRTEDEGTSEAEA